MRAHSKQPCALRFFNSDHEPSYSVFLSLKVLNRNKPPRQTFLFKISRLLNIGIIKNYTIRNIETAIKFKSGLQDGFIFFSGHMPFCIFFLFQYPSSKKHKVGQAVL